MGSGTIASISEKRIDRPDTMCDISEKYGINMSRIFITNMMIYTDKILICGDIIVQATEEEGKTRQR